MVLKVNMKHILGYVIFIFFFRFRCIDVNKNPTLSNLLYVWSLELNEFKPNITNSKTSSPIDDVDLDLNKLDHRNKKLFNKQPEYYTILHKEYLNSWISWTV